MNLLKKGGWGKMWNRDLQSFEFLVNTYYAGSKIFRYPMIILILLGFTIPFHKGLSQEINRRFRHYTSLEELSQNTVDCILRDKSGFMWFGTWNGLNRFDRYHFTVYKTDNQGNSLSNNFVYSLSEDTCGNLWIGTKYGLNQYEFTHDRFRSFFHNEGDYNTLSDNQINAVCCDHEGFIWAGSSQNGLDKIKYDYKLQKRGEIYGNIYFTAMLLDET
jgi:ligand-binding sensor domain-containing protein